MAKKKTRQKKTISPQSIKNNSLDLGVPKKEVGAFMALYNAKQLSQAQQAAQRMTENYPDSAFAWKALGTTLLEAGDFSAALAPLLRSYEFNAEDALMLTSLAAVYYRQGEAQQAIKHQMEAVALQPQYAPAQYRLAEMLQSSGQHAAALEYAQKSLELGYDELKARLLIGSLQYQTKYFSRALENYLLLENEFPGNHSVYNNLGNLYKDMGEYKRAESYYQKALAKRPDFVMAYSNIFFSKHYDPSVTQEEIIDFAKGWDERFSLFKLSSPENVKKLDKSLKVGLISSGFRTHPVGQMITAALERSRSDINFYAYSTSDINDQFTKKISNVCKQWRQVRHLSQKAIAEQIRNDEIDILIDLSGHGDGSCLQAISMRPAPLCIKWVGGLVNTMGLESIDYLLSDSIETPEGVDDQYTEKLIRLPDDYICYSPCEYAPNTTSLPALKNRYITLGCLNNAAKISAQLLGEWAILMHQLPKSRLLLRGPLYESQDYCQRIWNEMAQHGIEQERILLEGPINHKDFIGTYQRIDIALDTWPYSGGLTTCEALLMGVPVVTLPGPTFAGRHSATHLINAGLQELVANSWGEYRQRVIELANDLPNLAVIRAGLRTILHYSPVCDAPRFANHFNNALRAIWVRYCEGKAPEALTFNKEGEMWFADEDALVELPECSGEEISDVDFFEWQIDKPITIIDNAAVLPRNPDYAKWMSSGHLAIISFDPASLLTKKVEKLKEYGEFHHYPHALLGDGQPTTLYATLDAEKGSTLKPLKEAQQLKHLREKLKVLAELPITTVALDSIEGLPSVDMLVLDDLHDAMKVLENGERSLKNTLLIQVRVAFQPSYEHQPNLAELQHWMARHGFRFYCFNNEEYQSHFSESVPVNRLQATELVNVNAIFLPTYKRVVELSESQCTKLAYLLHSMYDIKDMTYALLKAVDSEKANKYLDKEVLNEKKLRVPLKREVIHSTCQLESNQREFTLCVGVPVYNEEKYILETIRSLKDQDFKDVKFLISDNCSTDRTLDIICEETAGDERFEVFKQPANIGASKNFEFVFKNSRSKYFMWLGAHDVLSKSYLSLAVDEIKKHSDTSMVMGTPVAIDEESNVKGFLENAIYDFSHDKKEARYLKSVAELSNCTVLHSVFLRKALDKFEFRATISADHVLISHLLWFGVLRNIDGESYFRRYFHTRTESQEERIAGNNVRLDRNGFIEYYLDDLKELLVSLSSSKSERIIKKTNEILNARFF
ncbi:glycosyltransferase [Halomonas sp. TD01]|uniref:O-linked N-acetylglucosamine transferase family protein n=1 Tax=Halomonas sp. TD01 TaxID=999141 RepID=UPI000214DEF9|nr:glycosyltransferase [Halomonas sp. TD01]EGP20205.1 hypothetical protein GME_07794 [Halomonas sp. TD01]CAH1043225.1 TPR domain protein, putative component of TonB system [Halomonas sp. TD01]